MLNAIGYQIREVVEAMNVDIQSGKGSLESIDDKVTKNESVKNVRVDGGVSANNLMMQIQADILGINVIRPSDIETTARGAAMAAAIGAGLVSKNSLFRTNNCMNTASGGFESVFCPNLNSSARETRYSNWKNAVPRSFHL